MRLTEPRVPALDPEAMREGLDKMQSDMMERLGREGHRVLNVFRTLSNHPELTASWLGFGNYILTNSTLPPREREIAILRIGWLCQSEYEWGQHAIDSKLDGLTEQEIERIKEGPDADGWNDFDAAILRGTDELHQDAFVSDETWTTLAECYDTKQLMDFVFTVGQYNLISMALNSFGVQLDDGIRGF
jgi:alkylhydroperoxidase family enzyme